jgi:hypothetical protein
MTTTTRHNTWLHKDLVGKKVGTLLIEKCVGSNGKKLLWQATCDCGRVVIKNSSDMQRAMFCSRECPFWKANMTRAMSTHGLSHHPLFAVWRSMCDRCRLPSHQAWKNYGGRGIRVCARWQSFEAFYADVFPTWAKGLCLDRIDNNGNYEPGNWRWATYRQQARNTRVSQFPDYILDRAEACGVNRTTLYYRVAHGWDLKTAATTPPNFRNKSTTCGIVVRGSGSQ